MSLNLQAWISAPLSQRTQNMNMYGGGDMPIHQPAGLLQIIRNRGAQGGLTIIYFQTQQLN